MSRVNSHGARVRAAIIAVGLDLWRTDPTSVSARGIGTRLKMTHSAVLYHFGSASALKHAVASEAVRVGDPAVVPHLIVTGHPAAALLTPEQRATYLSGC